MELFNLYKTFKWRKLLCTVVLSSVMLVSFGCQQKKQFVEEPVEESTFQFISGLDTLQLPQRYLAIEEKLYQLEKQKNDQSMIYGYLQGLELILKNEKDSANHYFTDFKTQKYSEWEILIKATLLANTTNRTGVVSAEQAESVFETLKEAEQRNSRFAYKLYDIFAMIHYNNKNLDGAIAYTEKYYSNHPYKDADFIKQRYHDISFLLNERNGDLIKMDQHFRAAREMAIKNQDSTALMRTYEYESQINIASMQLDSAIQNMKKHLTYAERKDRQVTFIYSNMGNLFYKNNQLDSAQTYFNKAIAYSKVNEPDANSINAYKVLSDIYAEKKNFAKAHAYLDTMLTQKEWNDKQKRDDYIEQLQTQYAVENKNCNYNKN